MRINELVFDAGYGSTDGFFFNASGLQWEGRGAGVFVGWLGMCSPLAPPPPFCMLDLHVSQWEQGLG